MMARHEGEQARAEVDQCHRAKSAG
jgi:hypothetical protein